jgi:hypothetical protein
MDAADSLMMRNRSLAQPRQEREFPHSNVARSIQRDSERFGLRLQFEPPYHRDNPASGLSMSCP